MKLCFKFAKSGGLFDKLIGWWTNGKYCHVEIWFDQIDPHGPKESLCFSSENGKGTQFSRIDLTDSRVWFIVTLPLSETQEGHVHDIACTLLGRRYAWLDIVGFLIPPLDPGRAKALGQPKEFICSAVATYLCQQEGLFEGNPPAETSPDLLADLAVAVSKEALSAK